MAGAVLLAGVAAVFAAILLVILAFAGQRSAAAGVRRGLASVERVYAVGSVPDRTTPFGARVAVPFGRRLGGIGRRLTPDGMRDRLQRSLDLAGNPVGWSLEAVTQVKGVALVIMAGFGALIGAGYGGVAGAVPGLVLGAAAGFYLPDLLVYNAGLRRQQELRRTLPDVLDMLTVSVEAGLGFDAAMAQVAANAAGPMVGESARVLQEMRLGSARADAMRAMAARTSVIELRTFASAVVQASELGIPVANVLREQAREMRVRRRQRAEELAQKVPVKILFPLIFLIFPALFVIILGPAVMRIIALFASA